MDTIFCSCSCLCANSHSSFQATEIGKAVNGLRKHGSKQIRHLARSLIEYGFVFVWLSIDFTVTFSVCKRQLSGTAVC